MAVQRSNMGSRLKRLTPMCAGAASAHTPFWTTPEKELAARAQGRTRRCRRCRARRRSRTRCRWSARSTTPWPARPPAPGPAPAAGRTRPAAPRSAPRRASSSFVGALLPESLPEAPPSPVSLAGGWNGAQVELVTDRHGEVLRFQPGEHRSDRLLDGLALGVQRDLRLQRRLVGVGDAGEVLDLARQRLGVQAFD